MPISHLTMHGPRALPAPTMSTANGDGPTRLDNALAPRSRRGIWMGVIAALLLGVGGALAYVKVTDDSGAPPSPVETAAPAVAPSEPVAPVAEPAPDASVAINEGSAADSASDAGVGSAAQTATIAKPVVKKPPIRKPPVKKPPVKKPPIEVAKPPDTPPVKKCDPFDSRVKC